MFENCITELRLLLDKNLLNDEFDWLSGAIDEIEKNGTARRLYFNYTLCGSKINKVSLVDFSGVSTELKKLLEIKRSKYRRNFAYFYVTYGFTE